MTNVAAALRRLRADPAGAALPDEVGIYIYIYIYNMISCNLIYHKVVLLGARLDGARDLNVWSDPEAAAYVLGEAPAFVVVIVIVIVIVIGIVVVTVTVIVTVAVIVIVMVIVMVMVIVIVVIVLAVIVPLRGSGLRQRDRRAAGRCGRCGPRRGLAAAPGREVRRQLGGGAAPGPPALRPARGQAPARPGQTNSNKDKQNIKTNN